MKVFLNNYISLGGYSVLLCFGFDLNFYRNI